MDSGTFKTRLVALLKKSRRAVRLYSEMEKSQDKLNYSDLQIYEWKNINVCLLEELQDMLSDFYNNKNLVAKMFSILERFQIEQAIANDSLVTMKKELILSSQKSDFAKSAELSLNLVGLKAKNQALLAVIHELNQVITKSNLTKPQVVDAEKIKLGRDVKTTSIGIVPQPTSSSVLTSSVKIPSTSKVILMDSYKTIA